MAKRRIDFPLDRFTAVAQAVSDESRVRILAALRGRRLCVCQITELLGLAPSTVSKHLLILRHAGLVESRKQGRWIHYGRPAEASGPAALLVFGWIDGSLVSDARLREDGRRLKEILKMPVETLCKIGGRR
jgi:DNA-binding transcriptional ArsR family regulator